MRPPIRLVPRNEAEESSLYSVMYGGTSIGVQVHDRNQNQNRRAPRQAPINTADGIRPASSYKRSRPAHRSHAKTFRSKQTSFKAKKGQVMKPEKPSQAGMKWRGLPLELIDHILSYCSTKDLLSLCTVSKAMYLHSLPHVYRNIKDMVWSDAITLRRRLESGMGPASTNPIEVASLVAGSIRDIQVKSYDQFSELRTHTFTIEETAQSLASIAKLTTNLRTLSWKSTCFLGDVESVLTALKTSSVQHLQLQEMVALPARPIYLRDSPLWRLDSLESIDLVVPSVAKAGKIPLIVGLARLIKNSTALKHLKITLIGMPAVHDDDVDDFRVKNVNGDAFFKVEQVSRLETIDLEGLISKNVDIMKSFLMRLEAVKKLRLVQGSERDNVAYDRHIDTALAKLKLEGPNALPKLIELETSMPLLKAILPVASPTILKDVPVTLPSVERHSLTPPSIANQMSAIKTSKSLEEMELKLFKYRGKVNRKEVVAALHCVPTNIKRLAIVMPWEVDRIDLEDSNRSLCFLAPLERLVNLEMINLNWSSFLYHENRPGSHSNDSKVYQERAIQIAQKLGENCPRLQFVMFQGSRVRNINNRVAWKIDWDVEADKGRRWTLEIERVSRQDQHSQTGVSADEKVADAGSATNCGIKVKILSDTCTCLSCFKREARNDETICRANDTDAMANDMMEGVAMQIIGNSMGGTQAFAAFGQMMFGTPLVPLQESEPPITTETYDGPRPELWEDID